MKRTPYERPTTEVVILQQRGQVMTGSPDGQAGVQDYTWHTVNPE
jgi:hypothetical protein